MLLMMSSFGCRAAARSFVVVAVLAAGAACSSMQAEGDRGGQGGQGGDTLGFRWTGPGEPTNFASAHSFCRSTVQFENFGNMSSGWEQRGAGTVTFNMPDTAIAGMGKSYQPGPSTRRSFDSCMASQGWSQATLAGPQPAAAPPPMPTPTPSSATPAPTPTN
ncbi:MAG: hypothetical protein U1E42_14615 [Rhodospirillales bacterium]